MAFFARLQGFSLEQIQDPGGLSTRWIEPARNLGSAKARLTVLGTAMPGKYVILSQATGNQRFFTLEDGEVSEGVD